MVGGRLSWTSLVEGPGAPRQHVARLQADGLSPGVYLAQLVQQEKLASLGQLTAGIAHEIKNPLNFIKNFAELSVETAQELEEALASGENVEALLGDLRQNASSIAQHSKRADEIVQAMMQHARSGSAVESRST